MKHTVLLLALLLPVAASAQEPVKPTTIIENDQTRIVRVDIQPSSTRSMHNHPDMVWHVFIAMDQQIVLNIQGQAEPVKLAPWGTHFFRGGITHSITNPNPRPAQFMEFFNKKPGVTAASNDAIEDALEDAMRALATTLARAAAEAVDNQSSTDRR